LSITKKPANLDILTSTPTRLQPRSRLKYARGQQGASHHPKSGSGPTPAGKTPRPPAHRIHRFSLPAGDAEALSRKEVLVRKQPRHARSKPTRQNGAPEKVWQSPQVSGGVFLTITVTTTDVTKIAKTTYEIGLLRICFSPSIRNQIGCNIHVQDKAHAPATKSTGIRRIAPMKDTPPNSRSVKINVNWKTAAFTKKPAKNEKM
jgi:hypothetical protein